MQKCTFQNSNQILREIEFNEILCSPYSSDFFTFTLLIMGNCDAAYYKEIAVDIIGSFFSIHVFYLSRDFIIGDFIIKRDHKHKEVHKSMSKVYFFKLISNRKI